MLRSLSTVLVFALCLAPSSFGGYQLIQPAPPPAQITNVTYSPADGGSVYVTLDPIQVTAINSPSDALRQTLLKQFPTYNFSYTGNNPGIGLNGEMDIETYNAVKGNNRGGADLEAVYTRVAGDPALANLQFIQLVIDPTRGTFIDNLQKPGDPFYYTQQLANMSKNANNGTFQFSDGAFQGPPPKVIGPGVSGNGDNFELYIVEVVNAKTVNIYNGVGWAYYQERYGYPAARNAAFTSVPEPGSCVLLLLGGLSAVLVRILRRP